MEEQRNMQQAQEFEGEVGQEASVSPQPDYGMAQGNESMAQPDYGMPQGNGAMPQPGYGMPPQIQPGYGMPQPPVPPQIQPGYGMPQGNGPMPQLGYGMPLYGYPPRKQGTSDGLAIASMVLGIVSILICLWFYISLPCAVVGLVLGCVYRAKGGKNGMSVAGIACSSVAIALAILMIVMVIFELTYMI